VQTRLSDVGPETIPASAPAGNVRHGSYGPTSLRRPKQRVLGSRWVRAEKVWPLGRCYERSQNEKPDESKREQGDNDPKLPPNGHYSFSPGLPAVASDDSLETTNVLLAEVRSIPVRLDVLAGFTEGQDGIETDDQPTDGRGKCGHEMRYLFALAGSNEIRLVNINASSAAAMPVVQVIVRNIASLMSSARSWKYFHSSR
jgi:hypothetical protein